MGKLSMYFNEINSFISRFRLSPVKTYFCVFKNLITEFRFFSLGNSQPQRRNKTLCALEKLNVESLIQTS